MAIIIKTSNEKFPNFKNKIVSKLKTVNETNYFEINEFVSGGSKLSNNDIEEQVVAIDVEAIDKTEENIGLVNSYNEIKDALTKRSEYFTGDTTNNTTGKLDEFLIPNTKTIDTINSENYILNSVNFFESFLRTLAGREIDRIDLIERFNYGLFDTVYAEKDIIGLDRSHSCSSYTLKNEDGNIYTIEKPNLYCFYKVEGATNAELKAEMFIRGFPIPLRKNLTSSYSGGYNFTFTIPEYLFRGYEPERPNAIRKIVFKNCNSGMTIKTYKKTYDDNGLITYDGLITGKPLTNKLGSNLTVKSNINILY